MRKINILGGNEMKKIIRNGYGIQKKNIDFYFNQLFLECCLCGAKVRVTTVKEQYKIGALWTAMPNSSRVMCPYCSHQLFNEHDAAAKNKSITCKCGMIIYSKEKKKNK